MLLGILTLNAIGEEVGRIEARLGDTIDMWDVRPVGEPIQTHARHYDPGSAYAKLKEVLDGRRGSSVNSEPDRQPPVSGGSYEPEDS